MKPTFLGVDTGGTFTDFVCVDSQGVRIHKVLSTPNAPEEAILQGIHELGLEGDMSGDSLRLIHGSTVATNAALENKGVKTAFVTNAGFADMLTLGRQARSDIYALQPAPEPQPVPAELCFELACRLDAAGETIQAVSEEALQALVAQVQAAEPSAVAINFLFSYLNPEQEQQVLAALRQVLDNTFICCSSDVLTEYKEYERGMATWLNAWLGPVVQRYLDRLQAQVAPTQVSVMQSHGGTVSAKHAADKAVNLLLSGPAGGLAAASQLGKLRGIDKQMTFDMGGTSTDVALIDGALKLTTEGRIGPYPVAVPMVDLYTVGAGGGSIAYLDEAGMLHVGPQSAGADPGPACYGRGGKQPTVSDANAVLGRLRPEFFLGGAMSLDVSVAREAIAPLADALGLGIEQTAEGMIELANEHIAAALRVISVQRGYDPQGFELCCFGGAGGLQVCDVADALQMRSILLPVFGGVLSAQGMLVAERRREMSQTLPLGEPPNMADVKNRTDIMRLEMETALANEGGYLGEAFSHFHCLDCRFKGQSFTLPVPLSEHASMASVERAFEDLHQKHYGYVLSLPVEVVTVRVSVSAEPAMDAEAFWSKTQRRRISLALAEPASKVALFGLGETAVYTRERLRLGNTIVGPALICEDTTTTLVQKNWVANVEENEHLLLTRRPA